jgi:hypothetical protein
MWASRVESIFVRRLLVVGVLGVMVMIGLSVELFQRKGALLLVRDVSDLRPRLPRA